MKTSLKASLVVLLAAALFGPDPARAVLLYYDGFNYAAGTPVGGASGTGLSGGTGWANGQTWYDNQASANIYAVGSSGMSYGSLATSGLALSQNNDNVGAQRSFKGDNTTLAGGTYYVSFLVSYAGNPASTATQYAGLSVGGAYFGIANADTGVSTARDLVVGGGYATNTTSTGMAMQTGTTYLMVGRIDFSTTGTDTISLWVDPTSGADPGLAGASATTSTIDPVNLTNLNAASFYASSTAFGMTVDEFRMGTTWADVTPGLAVPEPETYALVGLAALLLLAIGRGRRAAAMR